MFKLIQNTALILVACFLCVNTGMAQESQMDAIKDVEQVKAEMKAAFGVYPEFMQALPDHLQAGAWDIMKKLQSPEAALSAKQTELIGLGVAAQVPCNYCVYFHSQMAKMFGATEQEIKEAVAVAANTRHWSTVLNGSGMEFDSFKQEIDQMLAFMQKMNETEQTTKK